MSEVLAFEDDVIILGETLPAVGQGQPDEMIAPQGDADQLFIQDGTVVLVENNVVEALIAEAIQGPAGLNGPIGASDSNMVGFTAYAMSGHRVVYMNEAGLFEYASNDVLGHRSRALGLTTSAAMSGSQETVLTFGRITEPSWNWTLEQPVFLGANGYLTQTPPDAPALFQRVVGLPVDAQTLFVSIQSPINLS